MTPDQREKMREVLAHYARLYPVQAHQALDAIAKNKGKPVKALTEGLTKKGGRNNTGRITARRIGGGAKKLYRKVDFKRNRWDVPALLSVLSMTRTGQHLSLSSNMKMASRPTS